MVKIEIAVDEDEQVRTRIFRGNQMVGWGNLSRAEQLALLHELSQSFFDGQRNLNAV